MNARHGGRGAALSVAGLDESWSAAMNRAIGDPGASAADVARSCAEVSARIRAAAKALAHRENEAAVAELLDVYDGALDLLRRWPQAVAAAESDAVVGNAQAGILLNDFRPIRPYAVRLGEDIERYERRVAAKATTGLD